MPGVRDGRGKEEEDESSYKGAALRILVIKEQLCSLTVVVYTCDKTNPMLLQIHIVYCLSIVY